MSENKKQLKDKNNQNINPITASDAVLRNDGSTVEDFMTERHFRTFTLPSQFSSLSTSSSLNEICAAMPEESILVYPTNGNSCPDEIYNIMGTKINIIEICKHSIYRTHITITSNDGNTSKQKIVESGWRTDTGCSTFRNVIFEDALNGFVPMKWAGNIAAGKTITIKIPTNGKFGLLLVRLMAPMYENCYIYSIMLINSSHVTINQLQNYLYKSNGNTASLSFTQHSIAGEFDKFDIVNSGSVSSRYDIRLLVI